MIPIVNEARTSAIPPVALILSEVNPQGTQFARRRRLVCCCTSDFKKLSAHGKIMKAISKGIGLIRSLRSMLASRLHGLFLTILRDDVDDQM